MKSCKQCLSPVIRRVFCGLGCRSAYLRHTNPSHDPTVVQRAIRSRRASGTVPTRGERITQAQRAMHAQLSRHGVPWVMEHRVGLGGHSYYTLDIALPAKKVCVEVDGRSHLGPRARAYDARRTARLQALGWTVYRISNPEALDPEARAEFAFRVRLAVTLSEC